MAQETPNTGSNPPTTGSNDSSGQQSINTAFVSKPSAPIINKQKQLELLFPEYNSITEPLVTAADLTMNPILATAAYIKNRIKQGLHNINVPVYGFTVEDPKMVKLEELYLYNHYMPNLNYAALNGIAAPDRIYASRVRVPILHDGGFMTNPEILKTPGKINTAISNHPICFVDGAYLSDLTVVPKDRLVKVKFMDKAYKVGRIIGVSEFNTVLADSIKDKFAQTGIPFQGLLGMFGGAGLGTGGEPANLDNPPANQEFWTLLAICWAESGGDNQGMADVAQSIYNRYYLANKYGGYRKSIAANVSTGRAYEPTFKNQADWQRITNEATAVAALQVAKPTYSQQTLQQGLQKALTSVRNAEFRAAAALHVGGRPDFLAGAPSQSVGGSNQVERQPFRTNNNFHVRSDNTLRNKININEAAQIPEIIRPYIEGTQLP